MADFPHLRMTHVLDDDYRSRRGGSKKISPRTEANLDNRTSHGQQLRKKLTSIQKNWNTIKKQRESKGLPLLPETVPVFLEIDPKDLRVDSLQSSFGIEVLSVEENGLIIGSSTDGNDFQKLAKKIDIFLNENGRDKNQAARLWNILSGEN